MLLFGEHSAWFLHWADVGGGKQFGDLNTPRMETKDDRWTGSCRHSVDFGPKNPQKKKRKNFTLELGYNGKDPIRGNSVKLGKPLAASVKNRIFVATWVSSSFFFFFLKNQIFAFVGSPQFWPFFFVQRQAFRNAKNSNGKLDFKNDFYGGGRRKNVHSEGFCWAQSPLLCCCLLKSISSHSCSFSFLLLLIFSLYRVFFQWKWKRPAPESIRASFFTEITEK